MWILSQSLLRAYLSAGRFPQEVGTAGPAPLSSDDLTEKKTDWINIVISWPCEVDAGLRFITTHCKIITIKSPVSPADPGLPSTN